MTTAQARFEIEMVPGEAALPATARFDFTKTWSGAMTGRSTGVMISAGDPASGNAGYVALEVFTGMLDQREGSVVLQQFGTMTGGDAELRYQIVPGSGGGELAGIQGTIELSVTETGDHQVRIDYDFN